MIKKSTEMYSVSTPMGKLQMTPVLPTGLGKWSENDKNMCMQSFSEYEGESKDSSPLYYCQGVGMIDTFTTDPSAICPKGSLIALTKDGCDKPYIAGDIVPNSNLNNYLCCKKAGGCGNLPVDSTCMGGTVTCKDWGPPASGCQNIPDQCVDAPAELGLPKNVGYCKGGNTTFRPVSDMQKQNSMFLIGESKSTVMAGVSVSMIFLLTVFVILGMNVITKRKRR